MILEKLTRQSIGTLKPTEEVVWVEGLNLGIWTGKRGFRWVVRLYVTQPDGGKRKKVGRIPNGKLRNMSPEEAQAFLIRAEAAALEGVDLTNTKTAKEAEAPATVGLLVDRYIAEADICETTRLRYKEAAVHIHRLIGDVPLGQYRKAHVLHLKDELREKQSTFNKGRDLLSAAASHAAEREWRHAGRIMVPEGFNPARLVKRYPPGKRKDPFNGAELSQVFAVCQKYLDPAFRAAQPSGAPLPWISTVGVILALFYSGCRKNEVMGLSWSEPQRLPSGKLPLEVNGQKWSGWVDWQAGLIRLINHKTARKKGPRTILLNERLAPVIAHMRDAHEFWVFTGPKGRLVNLDDAWRRILKEAGVRYRNLHQTRHTFISLGLNNGAHLGPMGGAVGHSTTYMTAEYATIEEEAARAAANTTVSHMPTVALPVGGP